MQKKEPPRVREVRNQLRQRHRQLADGAEESSAANTTETEVIKRQRARRAKKDLTMSQLPSLDIFSKIFSSGTQQQQLWTTFCVTPNGEGEDGTPKVFSPTTKTPGSLPINSAVTDSSGKLHLPPSAAAATMFDSDTSAPASLSATFTKQAERALAKGRSNESLENIFASEKAPTVGGRNDGKLASYLGGVPPPNADDTPTVPLGGDSVVTAGVGGGPSAGSPQTMDAISGSPQASGLESSPSLTAQSSTLMVDRSIRSAASSPLPSDLLTFEMSLRRSIQKQHRVFHFVQLTLILLIIGVIVSLTTHALMFVSDVGEYFFNLPPIPIIGNEDASAAELPSSSWTSPRFFFVELPILMFKVLTSWMFLCLYLSGIVSIYALKSSSSLEDQTVVSRQVNSVLGPMLGLQFDCYSGKLLRPTCS